MAAPRAACNSGYYRILGRREVYCREIEWNTPNAHARTHARTHSILFAIAVWPVYHILTLPLMFLLFMGFVHALQFLPYTDAGKKPESSKKK